MKTAQLSKSLSSEDWAEIRDETAKLQNTLLWRLATAKFEKQTSLYYRELMSRDTAESNLRFAQGYISGMRYAIMILDEISKDAANTRNRETVNG